MKKTILVIGGAGYIGSHTAFLLAQQQYHVLILDNFVHHQPWHHSWATLIRGDLGDQQLLDEIFSTHTVDAVMHFAAFIEVGRSVNDPASFYDNNVVKTIALLNAMHKHLIKKLIFSSSCAVYGIPTKLPITEDHPKNPISPYGKTKLMVEMILHDYAHAYGMAYVALRYFNAAGAMAEYGLGEHHEPETHVIPLLLNAAHAGIPFTIFGTDHATPDGTCIRDYLHVRDIAQAHIQALNYLQAGNQSDCFNLGTGTGISVQELIAVTQEVTGNSIVVVTAPKRAGDPAILVADAQKAQTILKWQAQYSNIHEIIQSVFGS